MGGGEWMNHSTRCVRVVGLMEALTMSKFMWDDRKEVADIQLMKYMYLFPSASPNRHTFCIAECCTSSTHHY
jgi:hypothetical protein